MRKEDSERIIMKVQSDYSEIIDYNVPFYPLFVKRGQLSNYDNYRAIPHWHNDIELIHVLSGEMQYDVNGEIVTLQRGEGILVNSRQFHFGFSEEQKECDFICILFSPTLLFGNEYITEHFVRPLIENTGYFYQHLSLKIPWQKQISDIIKSIYELEQDHDKESFVLFAQQYMSELLTVWYKNASEYEMNKEKKDTMLTILRSMTEFVRQHYPEALSLSDIAKSGHVGKTYCCSIFKKYMHMTPIEYLNNYRLSQSMNLLLHTELTVSEIAFESGFRGASYYTELFHKTYGQTPTAFRKKNT